jgi:hypothetical protein
MQFVHATELDLSSSETSSWGANGRSSTGAGISGRLFGGTSGCRIRDCVPRLVRSHRAGKLKIAAVAYSYLLQQMKYKDTNKELAIALLCGVKQYYDQT